MNILYITPLWSGVKPFFLEGKEIISGMPAFFNVFKSILEDDRVSHIHIIMFTYGINVKTLLPEAYKHKVSVYPISSSGKMGLYISALKSIRLGLKLVKKHNIKSIYGQGTISATASIIGKLSRVRHFRRIYGTFLYRKLKEEKSIMRENFFEYLAFKMKCNGLIITNDGTHGDRVFEAIGDKQTDLHYLLNGLQKDNVGEDKRQSLELNNGEILNERRFFSYVARVDEWKRQHLLIEAIKILIDRGVDVPTTYIVGNISSKDYHDVLIKLIAEYNLEKKIIINGPTDKSNVPFLLQKSIATFSLYDFSNLGNVFLESLALGSVMVAINEEGSLDEIPTNTYVSLQSEDIQELANKIQHILENSDSYEEMRKNAKEYALNTLMTWTERVNIEKEIVLGLS